MFDVSIAEYLLPLLFGGRSVIVRHGGEKDVKYLIKNKFQYGFHYPYVIHQFENFNKFFKNQKYPNSEKIAKEGISLPIDPNLSLKEIKKITKVLNNFS